MKLNEKIRRARLKAEYTQIELANLVGIKASQIARWECGYGNPGPENLELLKQYLNLEDPELADIDPQWKTANKSKVVRGRSIEEREQLAQQYLLLTKYKRRKFLAEHGISIRLINQWCRIMRSRNHSQEPQDEN